MDIDYNKLVFFLTVVRSGGLTAAAKKLYRTQSAVSQALNALERQLGFKLITWEGKRLRLTREGTLVYNAAENRLRAIEEEVTAIKSSGQEVGGSIEIGMLNDASTQLHELLFTKIAQFRTNYPAVTFKIHFHTSVGIEQALLDREIDLGFLINFRGQQRFRLIEISTEQHLVVASPQYLTRVGGVASVSDVISKDLIDIDQYFTCFTPWVEYHDAASLPILEKKAAVIAVPDFRAIEQLVLAHQGIAVVPKYLVDKDLARGRLVQVLPKLSALQVWVSCAIERGRQERPCEELFLKTLSLKYPTGTILKF
ncbi:MAG: LysR family transcriptional regulator [Verrucomicrobia bacterium]|nr:LysR family transcriptional regulator [Verrucomicrobiota bacterium]